MLAFVDANLDPADVARVDFVQRDQLVDDQVRFVATAAVQHAARDQDRIRLDQMTALGRLSRPGWPPRARGAADWVGRPGPAAVQS